MNRSDTRQVTFTITTHTPLPVGEQVFITGNHRILGNWDAEGFPLTRTEDNLWTGTALLPSSERIEFKITRGDWASEEILDSGSPSGNHVIEAGGDAVAELRVAAWKDNASGPTPQITGDYHFHEGFHSQYLRFDRRVIVWLPPSYQENRSARYPVLYMHDGQQVFDPQTSTWKQDWQVDEWCTQLMEEHKIHEVIVVAIYSTEDRFVEYNPSLAGPEYTRFVIEELKPFIDRQYRTLPDRANTAVAGSSLGGSIAFHMAWTHPEVFFGAACLSPAFRFRDDTRLFDLVRETPRIPDIRLFFYCGLGDPTEQELAEGMYAMADLLRSRGFGMARILTTEDPAGQHNETAWARHTPEWLRFLFGK